MIKTSQQPPESADIDLPEGWATSFLGQLVSPSKEKVEPGERPNALYLSLEHIESGTGRILGHGLATDIASTKAVFRAGDILYGKLRPYLNKVCIPTFDGICSTDILVFPKSEFVDSRYLLSFLMLPSVVEFANHNMSGVQLPRISFEKLAELAVPLAPLAEQKRIVAKVEMLLERVNAARARLDKISAILTQFRQSVLVAACSGRLTEDWREGTSCLESGAALVERIIQARVRRSRAGGEERPKSGSLEKRKIDFDGDLPEIPESWCWSTWDDLTDWITYGFTRPMPHVQEGIPIVTARHIVGSGIDFSTVDFTTKQAFGELSKKDKPRAGEILLTKDGSIGRAAIVDTKNPFCVNQSVAVLRFGGLSADTKYLLRVIESPWTQYLIEEGAKGSAIRHISITALGRFPLPVPPLAEQAEIARRVDTLLVLADRIEDHICAARGRAEQLPQTILARALRGELVSTEAQLAAEEGRDYEPASVLLERIQESQTQRKPATRGRGGKDMAKRSRRQPAKTRRRLDEVLREQAKPLTPERLFDLTGYDEGSVDGFYEQLRKLIETGKVRENRPNRKDVTLEIVET